MKCFDTFRLAAIAALLLGIIGCAKEEYIEIPLELDQQGSALVAPLKVDLSSGLTKSFDADNKWYWEPSDIIYGYQCTGSFYENNLTQVDSENAPGVFSVENFRYSTPNPAPILFVYKGKEHSIGTWSNNVTISTYSSKQQGKWDPVIVGCLPNVTMPLNGGTVDMQYLTSAIEVRYWKEGTPDSMLDANRKTIKYINLKRNSGDLLLNVQSKQNPDGTISFEDKRTNERSDHVWAENVNASSVVFNISPQLEPYIFGDLVVEIHDENDIRNTFTVPSVPLEPGKKLVLNHVANMPTGPQLNKILKEFLRYRSTVTRLCVVTNSTQTSDNALVAGSVYMVVNGEALELHTAKSELVMDADCSSLFERLRYLEEIDMRGMNFRKITNMSKMFAGCSALKSIDLSHINTSNVTNMSGLFGRSYEYSSYLACSSLTNINLGSNFNTDKVTDMSWMFASCNSLPMSAMNLSRFNTANVINMQYMFAGNTQITSFDFSMLNYSNVTDMSAMFENCINLTNIDMTGQSHNTALIVM